MFAGWKMHLAFAYFLRKKFERRVAYLLTSQKMCMCVWLYVFVCRLDVLYVGMKVRMRMFVCFWSVCVDVWDVQKIYVSFINILMGYCEIL